MRGDQCTHLSSCLNVIRVVGLVHRGEAGAESGVVGSLQGIVTGEAHYVDVIVHKHNITDFVSVVKSSSCIRCDNRRYADQFHHSDWHRALTMKNDRII